jgi:hypothetical protein
MPNNQMGKKAEDPAKPEANGWGVLYLLLFIVLIIIIFIARWFNFFAWFYTTGKAIDYITTPPNIPTNITPLKP